MKSKLKLKSNFKLKLKPSMRQNKRYLLLQDKADKKDIEKAILDYIGILGYAKANPQFIKIKSEEKGKEKEIGKDNVLCVNREEIDKVRASLALADIKVLRVSGTLRKLMS